MTTTSYYIWPGQVHFGFGAARRVGHEAQAEGAKHVFVIADPGVVAAGLLEPVGESLEAAGLAHMIYTNTLAAVQQIMQDVGLPTRLRDVGVTEEMIAPMAKLAYTVDLNWWTNPRAVNEQAMEQLYRAAF